MYNEILEMDAVWKRTALMNPLFSLRRKFASVDPLSPALVLTPGEFGMFAYGTGESRVFLLVDIIRLVHPQPSFWDTSNNEQLLFKCIWLCRFYDIEEDAALIRGDCSSDKSLEFWHRFMDEIVCMCYTREGKAKQALVDEIDWSITPNDAQYDWKEFISIAFRRVFNEASVVREGSSAASSGNGGNRSSANKKTRMKFTLKDVLALDKLNTMGVLMPANIAELTSGMKKIEEQIGNPEDYIEGPDKLKAQAALDKSMIVKKSVERMLKIWRENDDFQDSKTAFMVAYAKSMVGIFERILETQRAFMVDVVNLLEKNKTGKETIDPAAKFVDKPESYHFL